VQSFSVVLPQSSNLNSTCRARLYWLSGGHHHPDRWQELLALAVERYQHQGCVCSSGADAAFAKPEVYEYLELRVIEYVIRLPTNDILEQEIKHLLKRPEGELPEKLVILYHDFQYQAKSWNRPRRVVTKVEWHRGELFPRVGFIVTNLSAKAKGLVHFYNGRGTTEQWIKEGKYALNEVTRFSCHRLVANQVRLQLFVLVLQPGELSTPAGLAQSNQRLVILRSLHEW